MQFQVDAWFPWSLREQNEESAGPFHVSNLPKKLYNEMKRSHLEIAPDSIVIGPKIREDKHCILYSAFLAESNKEVVVRRYRHTIWSSTMRNQIVSEIYNLSLLADDALTVKVLGYVVESGAVSVVMENVKDYFSILNLQSLPLRRFTMLSIALHIAGALQALQDKAIQHGNINPSNILINPRNMVRLTGFGSSGGCTNDFDELIYEAGPFSAPEVHRLCSGMDGALTCKSDMWSFGAVLLYAATGFLIYDTEDSNEVNIRSKLRDGSWQFERDTLPQMSATETASWSQQCELVKFIIQGCLVCSEANRLSAQEVLANPLYKVSAEMSRDITSRDDQITALNERNIELTVKNHEISTELSAQLTSMSSELLLCKEQADRDVSLLTEEVRDLKTTLTVKIDQLTRVEAALTDRDAALTSAKQALTSIQASVSNKDNALTATEAALAAAKADAACKASLLNAAKKKRKNLSKKITKLNKQRRIVENSAVVLH